MRLALKFGYDGTRFHGYQRQRGLRTVEGEVLRALGELGGCGDPKAARFASASRTDAGVSAVGNVVGLDTDFRTPGLVRALNSKLEDIWFWAFAEAPPSFNPRHARQRWYRYYLPRDDTFDLGRMRDAASLLEGRHDFKAFSRAQGNTVRLLTEAAVNPSGPWILLDFRGEAFLWNMVRRSVSALEKVGRGQLDVAAVEEGLRGRRGDFGSAPAWGLVLMDVTHDLTFHRVSPRPTLARLKGLWDRHRSRIALLEEILARMDIQSAKFGNL